MALDGRYLRSRDTDVEQRASWLELFFDLVFVFAITQLSQYLLSHLTAAGAAKTFLLLLFVWWAWINTTWQANWFDPEAPAVRVVLIGAMLASLSMAIALPDAFADRGLLFACSYAVFQIGRTAFAVLGAGRDSLFRLTVLRILVWSVAVGIVVVAGGALDGSARVALWVAAVTLDYVAPYARYWSPWLGRSSTTDWEIETSHFAERFQLFVIIALGESIVVTGATAAQDDLGLVRGVAIAVAFLTSAALWWLYFDFVAQRLAQHLGETFDRGRIARDAYTYLHIPIIAGIIVSAVGDELVIEHPGSRLGAAALIAVAGGPALYLLGHVVLRLRVVGTLSTRRLLAAIAIGVVGAAGAFLPALAVAALVLAVLAVVIFLDARLVPTSPAGRIERVPA